MKRIIIYGLSLLLAVFPCNQQISADTSSRAVSYAGKSASFLVNGILNGRYKQPGWREYFVTDRIELPEIHIGTLLPHPRLITPVDLARARAKVTAAPYSDWYALLRSRLSGHWKSTPGFVRDMAEYAKTAAFVAEIDDDPVLREYAIEMLRGIPEPPSLSSLVSSSSTRGWGEHLEAGEAVIALCAAYDLLYQNMLVSDRDDFSRKLLRVVDLLVTSLDLTSRNNHVTVVASAVCTAALTFDEVDGLDLSRRDDLLDVGMEYLSLGLGLIAPDGGYAEGPYYARYILGRLAPLSVYLMNTTGIRLFENPSLERMVNWVLDNHKGGGKFTTFDDSYDPDIVFLPLITGQSRSDRSWRYFESSRPAYKAYTANLVEAITRYEKEPIPPVSPVFFPGRFYADTGQALFRDRWPDPHLFASLLFEQERYFADMHEHIDPLSIELALNGEPFIVGGGYGDSTGDPDRSYFISPRSNSAILVDGCGTDPNPRIGDETEGRLMFGFSTRSFAAASISHRIADADISRQVFFSKDGILIMLDTMQSGSEHNYTIQYNTPGTFQDFGDGHIRFRKGKETLDSFQMFDAVDRWRYDRSGGRTTARYGVADCSVLGISSEPVHSASVASVWMEGSAGGHDIRTLPLRTGSGQWRQIHDPGSGITTDIMKLSSESASTAFMTAGGSLAAVRYNSPDDPLSFLIVNCSQFGQGPLSLGTSRPVTCYLERNGLSWHGVIMFDPADGPVDITVAGIDVQPVISDDGPIACNSVSGKLAFSMLAPGRIAFGTGTSGIDIPHPHTVERDSLRNIMARIENRPHGAYAADYDTPLARNQASSELFRAGDKAFEQFGKRYFDDPDAVRNAANTVQGLIEHTFHSARKGGDIVLPHRYTFAEATGPVTWELREEGTWHSLTPRIEDIDLRGSTQDDTEFRYRYERPFSHEHRQRVSMRWQDTAGVGAGYRRGAGDDLIDVNTFYRSDSVTLRPDVTVAGDRLTAFRFDGSIPGIRASFSGDGIQVNSSYAQVLNGRYREISWRLAGAQDTFEDRQRYTADVSGFAAYRTRYAGGIGIDRTDDGSLRDGYLNLSGQARGIMHMQRVEYHDDDLYVNSSAGWSGLYGRWSGGVRLKNALTGRENETSLQYYARLPGNILFSNRMTYQYSRTVDAFRLSLRQRYSYSFRENMLLSLIHHEYLGLVTRSEAIGGGIALYSPVPLNVELVRYIESEPVEYTVGWNASIPSFIENRIVLSGFASYSESNAEFLEMRLYELSGSGTRKGFWYRELHPREKTLECYFEWQF